MKPLPTFDAGKVYALKGETLNQIMDAIRALTPKAGTNITATEGYDGVTISAQTAGSNCLISFVDNDGILSTLQFRDGLLIGSTQNNAEACWTISLTTTSPPPP